MQLAMQPQAVSYQWDARSAPNMRLSEIAAPFHKDTDQGDTLVALLNYMLSKSDEPKMEVPTAQILTLMKNSGMPATYDELEDILNSSDAAKKMLRNLSPAKAIIAKSSEPEDPIQMPGTQQDVTKMAARAATKAID